MLENVYKKKIKEIRKIDFNNWDLFGIISLRIRNLTRINSFRNCRVIYYKNLKLKLIF